MTVDILFPVLLVAIAAWFTLARGSWRTIGTATGGTARSASLPTPAASAVADKGETEQGAIGARGPRQEIPAVKLVPTEGFIPDDRSSLIGEAERRLEGHVAYERVQLRPGWLLFDPLDVLGQPPVVIRFASELQGQPDREVWLYAIEDIRRQEREHSYLAECRRASIQARWDERRDAIRRRDIAAAAD
ncbi:MAG: hypothetical protein R3D27_07455 [Hyphomicrobiaceae bacterium]